MAEQQTETGVEGESYATCQGTDCGIEIIALSGSNFRVTVETPWGEKVDSGVFCADCMVKLAMLGVKLHDLDAIRREVGAGPRREQPKKAKPVGSPQAIRSAAIKMMQATLDLGGELEPLQIGVAALLAALTMGNHQMNEDDLHEGIAELLKLTAPFRAPNAGRS